MVWIVGLVVAVAVLFMMGLVGVVQLYLELLLD